MTRPVPDNPFDEEVRLGMQAMREEVDQIRTMTRDMKPALSEKLTDEEVLDLARHPELRYRIEGEMLREDAFMRFYQADPVEGKRFYEEAYRIARANGLLP